MIKKRIVFLSIVIMSFYFIIVCRLIEIQLIYPESFSKHNINLMKESVNQRVQEVVIHDGRGEIIDRNGTSIKNQKQPTVILFPIVFHQENNLKKLANALDTLTLKDIKNKTSLKEKEPILLNVENNFEIKEKHIRLVNQLDIPGIYGVLLQTTRPSLLATHLIGFTYETKDSQGILKVIKGNNGIEHSFDSFLQSDVSTRLLYHVDGKNQPMFGDSIKFISDVNAFYPLKVKTTIDLDLQRIIEEVLNSYHLDKGGAVLLEVESNEVLAMASRPKLDRNDPKTYLNHMLTPHFPGSTFKIVTASAAIEQGMIHPNETFDCNLDLYGKEEKELNKRLGNLNFTESFAKSCNYTFAELGKRMFEQTGEDTISTYARKLGLVETVGWSGDVFKYKDFKQISEEQSGVIWSEDANKYDDNYISQTAIGQKDVKMTPLAVANMVATIARGGERKSVKMVSELLFKNNVNMFHFKDQTKHDSISPYTAIKLQNLMRHVITEGTGKQFLSLPFEIAGKSGTAETGKNGLYNKWFAGYFPFDSPKYVLVVVDLETSKTDITNKAFTDIVKLIAGIEQME
ncbi:penicillin-binding protein 2 [Bacillus carboniphilus]|uniref:serine-type D-Ala-D-Ala carboxypeptidase n=1 Tax=Bacillus carboniphilus TaxID=86663 RepID=A0ABY9K0C7_9BACI|nr:penicillin-binding protein 2 [Bacillus carboniphilus]WLR44028.1 penicillin-binding protein 2 [Bacillus carboniphilus]